MFKYEQMLKYGQTEFTRYVMAFNNSFVIICPPSIWSGRDMVNVEQKLTWNMISELKVSRFENSQYNAMIKCPLNIPRCNLTRVVYIIRIEAPSIHFCMISSCPNMVQQWWYFCDFLLIFIGFLLKKEPRDNLRYFNIVTYMFNFKNCPYQLCNGF